MAMSEKRRNERWVVSGHDYSAKKQKGKTKEERFPLDLEVCLKSYDMKFMYVTIPGFCKLLESLTALPSSSSSSSSSSVTVHHHIYGNLPPVSVDAAISNILSERFPVLFPHDSDFTSPFSLPNSPNHFFDTTVVGSTLFCLGGDVHDIDKHCFDDIFNDRIHPSYTPFPSQPDEPPPPPPVNSIQDQFLNFIDSYYNRSLPVNDPPHPDLDSDLWNMTDDMVKPNLSNPDPCHMTDDLVEPNLSNPDPCDMTDDLVEPNLSYSNTTSTSPSTSNTIKGGICHKAWMYDLRNPGLGWSQSKPLISPRLYPHLVSYQGKLYVFSGNQPSLPFAEVYDPLSNTWTQLPPPPFGRLPDNRMIVLPLNGWNKIWVFSDDATVDYTFHVLTSKWQRLKSARPIIPFFSNIRESRIHFVSALNPANNHMLLYWISPGQQQKVYAYNLSTKQLFMGLVPGTDCVEGHLVDPLVMHHLQRDIFCLIGSGYDHHYESPILHVIVLQITTNPAPSKPRKTRTKTTPEPLIVAILACLSYPLNVCFDIFDTYLMSNNI